MKRQEEHNMSVPIYPPYHAVWQMDTVRVPAVKPVEYHEIKVRFNPEEWELAKRACECMMQRPLTDDAVAEMLERHCKNLPATLAIFANQPNEAR
jgi:hypothetical protein